MIKKYWVLLVLFRHLFATNLSIVSINCQMKRLMPICMWKEEFVSLCGTRSDNWDSKTSTLLCKLLFLILNEEPYYNQMGFENCREMKMEKPNLNHGGYWWLLILSIFFGYDCRVNYFLANKAFCILIYILEMGSRLSQHC